MNTHCSKDQLVFSKQNRRSVLGEFDGEQLTSDVGEIGGVGVLRILQQVE